MSDKHHLENLMRSTMENLRSMIDVNTVIGDIIETSDGTSIVPISNEKHLDFAEEVYKKMREVGIRVNLDDRSESMNYKIRESLQGKKVPYVCVIGDKEIEANSVAVRKRGVGQVGTINVDEFIEKEIDIVEEVLDSIQKSLRYPSIRQ